MKIIIPSAMLLQITPNPEQHIERCGRICYKSEDRITDTSAAKFVRMIVQSGHHSVLEHAVATVVFVCDRGVTHELVRHRLVSYSQESTRYCNYGKDKFDEQISVIRPPGLGSMSRQVWKEACETAERAYLCLLRDGLSPQIARSVLPTCLKTEIAVTANLREWRHIITLRISKAAHPQIREIMEQALSLLRAAAPNVFYDTEIQQVPQESRT